MFLSSAFNRLTDRERQVLSLIAQGLSSKAIAAQLGISFKTAVCHRTRIQQKLDIHDIANLTRYAIRTGLISAVLVLFIGV